MSAANLSGPSLEPIYHSKCYVVSMQFSLNKAAAAQIVGYYDGRSLAYRVRNAVYSYFMVRIRGGVELALKESLARIKKVAEGWQFIDPVETSWNSEAVSARISSLAEYAKTIAFKVVDADGERLVKIFIDLPPPTAKRKAEPAEERPQPKRQKTGPKEELIKLGFDNFDENNKKELRAAYKKWVVPNHPDRFPAGPEKVEAEERFRTMRTNYEALVGEDESDCKDCQD